MINVGMVGVGCISGIYLKNLHEVFHDKLRLVAVWVSISDSDSSGDGRDSYFVEAAKIIVDKEKIRIVFYYI